VVFSELVLISYILSMISIQVLIPVRKQNVLDNVTRQKYILLNLFFYFYNYVIISFNTRKTDFFHLDITK